MSVERLALLQERLQEAIRLWRSAIATFARWRAAPQDEVLEKAFQKFVLDGYAELEAVFLGVLRLAGEAEPSGRDWHTELAELVHRGSANRPPLAASHARDIAHARAFRHVCAHAYRWFDPERAELAVRALDRLIAALPEEFGRFCARWTAAGSDDPAPEEP